MFILCEVRNGVEKYDPTTVGTYSYVKRVSATKPSGIVTRIVSYAYYLGIEGATQSSPFKEGSIEECHFKMGCLSKSKTDLHKNTSKI